MHEGICDRDDESGEIRGRKYNYSSMTMLELWWRILSDECIEVWRQKGKRL